MREVAVVGAGPFGLSIAATIGGRACAYGMPLETWRTLMPPDMLLRSAWEETSLHGPGGMGTIDDWARAEGLAKEEPLPVQLFLRYGDWFRENYVRNHDPSDIARIEDAGRRVRVTTVTDAIRDVDAVVIAVGVTPFSHAPAALEDALGENVGFAIEAGEPERYAGRAVLVVGAGQAGLETAGVLAGTAASVEVVTRSTVRWFADREPHHERGAIGRRLYRLAYPAVGYGPPPLNRVILHPDAFARLPAAVRGALARRLLRPGGSPWVRSQVEGRVHLTPGVVPTHVDRRAGRLRVTLSDGSEREVDDILLAMGYRFDLNRLTFLDHRLRARIQVHRGWPVLNRAFASSDPRIFFAGYPAEGRFGPISRFVLGCAFTAARIAGSLR